MPLKAKIRRNSYNPLKLVWANLGSPQLENGVNSDETSRIPLIYKICTVFEHDLVHIRVAGNWTRKVHSLFKNGAVPRIIIDGPYGSPSQGLYDYGTVLCCGTGIGITPFASFLRSVIHRSRNGQMNDKKIYFIWIANQIQCFEWFDDLLGEVERDAPCVSPQIYLTMSNLDVRHLLCGDKELYKFGRKGQQKVLLILGKAYQAG